MDMLIQFTNDHPIAFIIFLACFLVDILRRLGNNNKKA